MSLCTPQCVQKSFETSDQNRNHLYDALDSRIEFESQKLRNEIADLSDKTSYKHDEIGSVLEGVAADLTKASNTCTGGVEIIGSRPVTKSDPPKH